MLLGVQGSRAALPAHPPPPLCVVVALGNDSGLHGSCVLVEGGTITEREEGRIQAAFEWLLLTEMWCRHRLGLDRDRLS